MATFWLLTLDKQASTCARAAPCQRAPIKASSTPPATTLAPLRSPGPRPAPSAGLARPAPSSWRLASVGLFKPGQEAWSPLRSGRWTALGNSMRKSLEVRGDETGKTLDPRLTARFTHRATMALNDVQQLSVYPTGAPPLLEPTPCPP